MASPPRILLFGAGGIGTMYAYILSQAGCSVTAVCRSNYIFVKEHGFTIHSSKYGQDIKLRPSVTSSIAETAAQQNNEDGDAGWDYIVICTKALPSSTPSTCDLIAPAVGPKTTIVLIQNGISIEDDYSARFPSTPLLSCVVYMPVTQTSPGIIEHIEPLESLEIGTYPATASAEHKASAQRFRELVKKGGGNAEVYDDIQERRWLKLVVNAVWNPICALSRSPDASVLAASEGAVDVVWEVMLEVVATAQAYGYTAVDEEKARWQIARAKGRLERGFVGKEPSMLVDVWEGRRMEVEAIVGNTVRLAKGKGVKVPRLETVYVCVKALDESIAKGYRGSLAAEPNEKAR